MRKKILALILCVVMVLSVLPMTALANVVQDTDGRISIDLSAERDGDDKVVVTLKGTTTGIEVEGLTHTIKFNHNDVKVTNVKLVDGFVSGVLLDEADWSEEDDIYAIFVSNDGDLVLTGNEYTIQYNFTLTDSKLAGGGKVDFSLIQGVTKYGHVSSPFSVAYTISNTPIRSLAVSPYCSVDIPVSVSDESGLISVLVESDAASVEQKGKIAVTVDSTIGASPLTAFNYNLKYDASKVAYESCKVLGLNGIDELNPEDTENSTGTLPRIGFNNDTKDSIVSLGIYARDPSADILVDAGAKFQIVYTFTAENPGQAAFTLLQDKTDGAWDFSTAFRSDSGYPSVNGLKTVPSVNVTVVGDDGNSAGNNIGEKQDIEVEVPDEVKDAVTKDFGTDTISVTAKSRPNARFSAAVNDQMFTTLKSALIEQNPELANLSDEQILALMNELQPNVDLVVEVVEFDYNTTDIDKRVDYELALKYEVSYLDGESGERVTLEKEDFVFPDNTDDLSVILDFDLPVGNELNPKYIILYNGAEVAAEANLAADTYPIYAAAEKDLNNNIPLALSFLANTAKLSAVDEVYAKIAYQEANGTAISGVDDQYTTYMLSELEAEANNTKRLYPASNKWDIYLKNTPIAQDTESITADQVKNIYLNGKEAVARAHDETTPTGNLVLTFHLNYGSRDETYPVRVANGATFTFVKPSVYFSGNTPNKEFEGWRVDDPNGNGTLYKVGDTLTVTGNKDFYAIWGNAQSSSSIGYSNTGSYWPGSGSGVVLKLGDKTNLSVGHNEVPVQNSSMCLVTADNQILVPMPGSTTIFAEMKGATTATVREIKDVSKGKVLAIVYSSETEEIVRKSYVDNNGVIFANLYGNNLPLKLVDNSKPFSDVASNRWSADYVDFASSHLLVNGYTDGTFKPVDNMTRGQFVTLLYRLEYEPQVSADKIYNDVDSSEYYANPVRWATQKGIVNGRDDETFDPKGEITREEMAVILYRYANYLKLDPQTSAAPKFSDVDDVSAWATNAMNWAVNTGIINGVKNGDSITLQPQSNATREQVATMIQRMVCNVVGAPVK